MYGARTYIIHAFNKMDDVPPEWVLAFEKQCGKPVSPHWFYHHLRNIYQYCLFFGGIVLGVTFDSLVLGGTIIYYNKTNEENYPLKGIIRWLIICLQFFALQWIWQFFFVKTMTNLWLRKFWLLLSAFVFFSI